MENLKTTPDLALDTQWKRAAAEELIMTLNWLILEDLSMQAFCDRLNGIAKDLPQMYSGNEPDWNQPEDLKPLALKWTNPPEESSPNV